MTRTVSRMGAALVVLAALVMTMPAEAQEWRPMDPSEAHLSVEPYAFGTRGIQRWVLQTVPARYERWATAIDRDRRFFQLVLRESTGNSAVAEDFDLRRFAAESLGSYAAGRLEWTGAGRAVSPLGVADYERFTFAGIACVAFQVPFGGELRGYPVNILKGLYCDPAVPLIPDFDLQSTLAAIDVVGYPR